MIRVFADKKSVQICSIRKICVLYFKKSVFISVNPWLKLYWIILLWEMADYIGTIGTGNRLSNRVGQV